MKVIGTAGHVDHGKSTLVQALTGINPDRLKEEQERQMTIDLGFAWLRMPDGEEVGVIDVPGHRDFIENMLAGISGIDAALLVVAADEGIMPQTREHLAILDLLEVGLGVVALTKSDLVDDPSWLELIEDDVRGLLAETRLREAAIVPVAATTGLGLEALVAALATALARSPERQDLGKPRLPVDRVFTMSGFGTVVTGTLVDGSLEVGSEVEVVPGSRACRIRGLQTHKSKVAKAVPGSRTAVNLTGIDVNAISRGDVVARPGSYLPTRRLDVRLRLLKDVDRAIRHDQRVKLFIGSALRQARLRLLGAEELSPGEEGWLQLVLDRPVVAARGDHFILRQASPGATLGGGRVADPHPRQLHRRKDARVLEELERQLRGTPGDVLGQMLVQLGPTALGRAVELARLSPQGAEEAIEELRKDGRLVWLSPDTGSATGGTDLVAEASVWASLTRRTESILTEHHMAFPLRLGMPREELKSRLGLDARAYSSFLAAAVRQGVVKDVGGRVALSGHQVVLGERAKAGVERLLARFAASPEAPPSYKEALEAVGEEVLAHVIESGVLVQVSAEVLLEGEAYRRMEDRVKQALSGGGTISVAEVRDLFRTSRKYALALMEHLDATGVTVREGDVRRLA